MSKFSHMNFSKFSQLSFCHISFELVYSWESYYKNKKGKLFIETQCIFQMLSESAELYGIKYLAYF